MNYLGPGTVTRKTFPGHVLPTDAAPTFSFTIDQYGGRTWIHELRLYNGVLSDAELLAVGNELRTKWSI